MITYGSPNSHKFIHCIPVPMNCPDLFFSVPGEVKRKWRYSDTFDDPLKAQEVLIWKIISSAHFPGRFLNWFWIVASLTIELKSLGQPLLQGCDLLHGIAIKSHTAKQAIQPEVAEFHTVLSFPQPKSVIWHFLSVAVNTLSQAFVGVPVSQSSLWLPPLLPSSWYQMTT